MKVNITISFLYPYGCVQTNRIEFSKIESISRGRALSFSLRYWSDGGKIYTRILFTKQVGRPSALPASHLIQIASTQIASSRV